MDKDAKVLLNTFSSINKLKKESRMNVDQVLVAANNRIHDVYKTLYVSVASYLIIIIGLTVSNSGEVDLICAVLAVSTAIVQIAAGDGAIKDIEALRNDMPKEMQNSILQKAGGLSQLDFLDY